MATNSLSCKQVANSILEFVDGEVGDELRALIEAHLQTCLSCSSRIDFERRLLAMLRGLQQGPGVDSAQQRLESLLERI